MNFKSILYGAGMFCIGASVGYYFAERKFVAHYLEEVQEVKDFYNEKLNELDSFLDRNEEVEKDEYEQIAGEYSDVEKTVARRPIAYDKPSLDEMKSRFFEEPDGEDAEENRDLEYEAELEAAAEELAKKRAENFKKGEPYCINFEEYIEGPDDYGRQTLYYYSHDRTLCEDDDTEVEEEEDCVGFDYEEVFDMQTTAWVRNDRLRMLYEIYLINDSYKHAVLDAIENPREREFRIQSRRKHAMDTFKP